MIFTVKILKIVTESFYNMSKKEIAEFETALIAYGKELVASKKKSEDFLIRIGVITKKGNVRKHYKSLCIQQDQD